MNMIFIFIMITIMLHIKPIVKSIRVELLRIFYVPIHSSFFIRENVSVSEESKFSQLSLCLPIQIKKTRNFHMKMFEFPERLSRSIDL